MGRVRNIAGRIFGKLYVIEDTEERYRGGVVWLCHCSCGNIVKVTSSRLVHSFTKSCGCLKRPDLTDMKFGRLVVVERTTKYRGKGDVLWKCLCSCGNIAEFTTGDLHRGNNKSCGCLHHPDITGMEFGRLTVLGRTSSKTRYPMWRCRCSCGVVKDIRAGSLGSKGTQSCGCLRILPDGRGAFNQLYNSYRQHAKTGNRNFQLSEKQFEKLTKGHCFYCETEPSSIATGKTKKCGDYVYNGIDRINNSKGYTIKNCVSCCGTCNTMKMAMSHEEFISHIKLVYEMSQRRQSS